MQPNTPPVETIRTYHAVDNRVKDHYSGFSPSYTEVINDLADMIDARRDVKLADSLNPFPITMAEKKLTVRTFKLTCPNKCASYIYKTAIVMEEINTRCVHCGSSALKKEQVK